MGTQSVRMATAMIGIMSPRIQPPTYLTVQQLLYTQARLYGITDDTLLVHYQRALRWCAIEQLAHKYIRQLSLFDVRRVMLACALINRPTLLLIDEPTVGLYAHEQHVMIDIIENLRDREMTIVSGLIAVVSGLVVLYSVTPSWGTPSDYLKALLWGGGVSEGIKVVTALVAKSGPAA
jgi:ABC-type cobalamin/Fe3+-siderophores transport system ATPase subunit